VFQEIRGAPKITFKELGKLNAEKKPKRKPLTFKEARAKRLGFRLVLRPTLMSKSPYPSNFKIY